MSKITLTFTAFALATQVFGAPVYAAAVEAVPSAKRQCQSEAQWPVTGSAAYAYGNARQRQQLRNGYSPEVVKMERLCQAMATAQPAEQIALATDCGHLIEDRLSRHGTKARAHAARLRAHCEVLSGQAIPVNGL